MSLWVLYKDGTQREHHIPFKQLPASTNVALIQADGDELDAIWELFHESIPFPVKKRVVKWTGDIASTILSNLS